MWPGEKWPVRIVPVAINTVQHPLPSLMRCLKLGRSIGRALESYEQKLRVMVVGTGGLSHQLDGKRAGCINEEFDQFCLEKIVNEPEALTRYSIRDWIEQSGAQGVEFLNWMAHARRAHRAGHAGAPQLSHPHLQHRGGNDRAGK
jgi:protocatechuate 4,5-dioxygenase beta chain